MVLIDLRSASGCVIVGYDFHFSSFTLGPHPLVYFGQAVGRIKMPLGMEVGLGPGDIVLDGDPARPHQKGGRAPPLRLISCLLWLNGWMDQDGTWYRGT